MVAVSLKKNKDKYYKKALEIQKTIKSKHVVVVGDMHDYYFDNNKLYRITTINNLTYIITIADGVISFATSLDNDKIVWWNDHELYVYCRNNEYYYNRLIGTSELISRFSESINSAGWFRDSDHVLVNVGTGANKLLEIDSRGGINIISL